MVEKSDRVWLLQLITTNFERLNLQPEAGVVANEWLLDINRDVAAGALAEPGGGDTPVPLVAYGRGAAEAVLDREGRIRVRIDGEVTAREARWWSTAIAQLASESEEHDARFGRQHEFDVDVMRVEEESGG